MTSLKSCKPLSRPSGQPLAGSQTGIALLTVLWLVAALTIMANGVLYALRSEVRLASISQRSTVDTAVADAAIRLLLQQLQYQTPDAKSRKRLETVSVDVLGQTVQIDIQPLNGFINLNEAPVSLLADALQFGAGLEAPAALRTAQRIDALRTQTDPKGKAVRFHATEELLGRGVVDYKAYQAIHELFTSELNSGQLVNPLAASMDVLKVLASGDEGIAQQFLAARQTGNDTVDTTRLKVAHLETPAAQATTSVQFTAHLRRDAQAGLKRTWRVDLSESAYGLPWRVLSMDAPKLHPAPTATNPVNPVNPINP